MSSAANQEHQKPRYRERLFRPYLLTVSIVGNLAVVGGLLMFPSLEPKLNFIFLLILSAMAQLTMTYAKRIGFSVESAVGMATVPLFGPMPAAMVTAVSEICFGLFSLGKERPPWKVVIRRLAFNSGMNSIAVVAAGYFYIGMLALFNVGEGDQLWVIVFWIIAAVINDQVNIWILIGIVHLQQGAPPLKIWQEHRWAAPINIMVTVVGGGVLAIAAQQFDFLGILIFFLPVLASAFAFRAYVNETQRQMENLEDIVEERTRELAEANRDLAQLNEEKDAFLAVLSHDMRSPLTSILLSATLLNKYPNESPEVRGRFVEQISRNQQTLLEMVNNILDIEQMKSGATIVLERQNFAMDDLVSEVVLGLEPLATEKNIELERDIAQGPLLIYADKQKIQRVVTNLISNAIKYTNSGGKICVRAGLEDHHLTFEVEDNGIGIPEDELPHIFSRFRRVKQHQKVAVGTGLGLSIVESLVEAHKGKIYVVSQEGAGSTFTVTIPK